MRPATAVLRNMMQVGFPCSSQIFAFRIGLIVCQVPFERTIVSMQPFRIVPDTCAVALAGPCGEAK